MKKAFTIIEALIAIFILALAFLSLSQIFPASLRLTKTSSAWSVASALGQGKMEEVFSLSYEETQNQAKKEIMPGYQVEVLISFLDPDNFGQSPTDKGIKKIQTIVYFQDQDKEKTLTLTSLKTKR